MRILLLLCLGTLPQSTLPRLPQSTMTYSPALPKGAVEYQSDGHTQEIAVTNGYDRITPVPIANLEAKWHGSGGLVGIKGWQSRKYRLIPGPVKTWVGEIQVLNSLGYYQANRGLKREYPDGTEFHDVLRNELGEVFEHRVRKKHDGQWESAVEYTNEAARPKGYTGLKVSCNSCHSEAGSGKYAAGLVPGGDTVLSDPLDWKLLRQPVQQEVVPTYQPTKQPTYQPRYSIRSANC